MTGIEVLATLVDELCAAAPTVIVIDDLQWADDASLILWHQLAASIDQLRLLLIGTCRSPLRRPEVQQVRAAVLRRGGAVITLGPLAEADVADLVTAMVGVPPGDTLRRLHAQAGGNPLYVRELVDALVREQALQVGPAAEVSVAREQLPVTLTAVLMTGSSSVPRRDGADVADRRPAGRDVRRHRPGRAHAPTGIRTGGRPAGGGGGRHPGGLRRGAGVPAPADPAGAVREHATCAARRAARRGGTGTRG